jgi:hypothetical protein
MESISIPMKRLPGRAYAMKLPTPQPGSRMVLESGTPKRAIASWIEAMTVGEV